MAQAAYINDCSPAVSPFAFFTPTVDLAVPRHGPAALLDGGLDGLGDLGRGLADLEGGEVLERARVLDVAEGGAQALLLGRDLGDGGLGGVDGLLLERADNLVKLLDVVVDGLEVGEDLGRLLDRTLVLEDALVVVQVDLGDGRLERGILVRRRGVARAEGLELGKGLCGLAESGRRAQTRGGGDGAASHGDGGRPHCAATQPRSPDAPLLRPSEL
jgi:hypothetical protein